MGLAQCGPLGELAIADPSSRHTLKNSKPQERYPYACANSNQIEAITLGLFCTQAALDIEALTRR